MKAIITIRDIVYPIPTSESPQYRTYEKFKIDVDGSDKEIAELIKAIEKFIPEDTLKAIK